MLRFQNVEHFNDSNPDACACTDKLPVHGLSYTMWGHALLSERGSTLWNANLLVLLALLPSEFYEEIKLRIAFKLKTFFEWLICTWNLKLLNVSKHSIFRVLILLFAYIKVKKFVPDIRKLLIYNFPYVTDKFHYLSLNNERILRSSSHVKI